MNDGFSRGNGALVMSYPGTILKGGLKENSLRLQLDLACLANFGFNPSLHVRDVKNIPQRPFTTDVLNRPEVSR